MLDQLMDPNTPLFWVFIGIISAIVTMIIWKRFKFIIVLMKFSYPNAKFNAMGNKYVLRQELERLIVTRNLTDATNLIISRDYQFKELRSIDELEHALDRTNLDFFDLILKDAPKVIKPLITPSPRRADSREAMPCPTICWISPSPTAMEPVTARCAITSRDSRIRPIVPGRAPYR